MNNLAIIILNWNNKELTNNCINSIKKQSYKDLAIIVVDNDSSDDSPNFLTGLHPDIKMIINRTNLGYAAGNNVGIRYALDAGYKFIFILNNDIELFPDAIEPLVCLLENKKNSGVVAPLALNYYENKNHSKECALYGEYNFFLGVFKPRNLNNDMPIKVKLAIGCALLFKSEVFQKCGLFDERFFMYFEEYDLLCSVANSGYLMFVLPTVKVYHREGSSSRYSKFPKNYYLLRNQLIFHKKQSHPLVFISFLFIFIIKLPWFLFRKRNIKDLRLHLAALRDFVTEKYYKTELIRRDKGLFS